MIKIISNIADVFSKAQTLNYAKAADGAVYVSNGYFLAKISQQQFGGLLAQIDRHRRKTQIELVEKPALIDVADKAKGNFEVSAPYEWEQKQGAVCVFADKAQHFAYNKSFVDIFDGNDKRMFVDDNLSCDVRAHNLVVKGEGGEVVGLVLPLNLSDETRRRLHELLPLENGFKTTIERIKENPTNDPYIGKEFFDGRDTHIIAAIRKSDGGDLYVVPTIENGELSGYAGLIDARNIAQEIERWELRRLDAEKANAANAVKSQQAAEKKAAYENTGGYADNQPPMQKARTLKALNDIFTTKEYGRLTVKAFIKAALADGKTLEVKKFLKDKYRGTDTGGRFRDESVLPGDCFKTEYRLMLGGNEFFNITKTAYDYGMYLLDAQHAKKPIAEQFAEGAEQAARNNAARHTTPKKAEIDL